MGYTVQLLAGEVRIDVGHHRPALATLQRLDRERDDLKSGWRRRATGGKELHWAFVSEDLQRIDDLPSMLRAIRFEPIELPDTGTIIGVRLAGGERSRGDERHFWAALAPFVEAGSHMDWYGEDDAVWRWRFTGERMIHIDGTLAFDE